MDTVTIDSWKSFVACADELDDWAFRGHRAAQQPLVSSLCRRLTQFCPDKSQWPQREARALRIFRRKAHIYLAERSVLEDDLRCLGIVINVGFSRRIYVSAADRASHQDDFFDKRHDGRIFLHGQCHIG